MSTSASGHLPTDPRLALFKSRGSIRHQEVPQFVWKLAFRAEGKKKKKRDWAVKSVSVSSEVLLRPISSENSSASVGRGRSGREF